MSTHGLDLRSMQSSAQCWGSAVYEQGLEDAHWLVCQLASMLCQGLHLEVAGPCAGHCRLHLCLSSFRIQGEPDGLQH